MIMAPIRLHGCAGWSAPLMFAIKKSQGFSCLCPYDFEAQAAWSPPGYAPAINLGLLIGHINESQTASLLANSSFCGISSGPSHLVKVSVYRLPGYKVLRLLNIIRYPYAVEPRQYELNIAVADINAATTELEAAKAAAMVYVPTLDPADVVVNAFEKKIAQLRALPRLPMTFNPLPLILAAYKLHYASQKQTAAQTPPPLRPGQGPQPRPRPRPPGPNAPSRPPPPPGFGSNRGPPGPPSSKRREPRPRPGSGGRISRPSSAAQRPLRRPKPPPRDMSGLPDRYRRPLLELHGMSKYPPSKPPGQHEQNLPNRYRQNMGPPPPPQRPGVPQPSPPPTRRTHHPPPPSNEPITVPPPRYDPPIPSRPSMLNNRPPQFASARPSRPIYPPSQLNPQVPPQPHKPPPPPPAPPRPASGPPSYPPSQSQSVNQPNHKSKRPPSYPPPNQTPPTTVPPTNKRPPSFMSNVLFAKPGMNTAIEPTTADLQPKQLWRPKVDLGIDINNIIFNSAKGENYGASKTTYSMSNMKKFPNLSQLKAAPSSTEIGDVTIKPVTTRPPTTTPPPTPPNRRNHLNMLINGNVKTIVKSVQQEKKKARSSSPPKPLPPKPTGASKMSQLKSLLEGIQPSKLQAIVEILKAKDPAPEPPSPPMQAPARPRSRSMSPIGPPPGSENIGPPRVISGGRRPGMRRPSNDMGGRRPQSDMMGPPPGQERGGWGNRGGPPSGRPPGGPGGRPGGPGGPGGRPGGPGGMNMNPQQMARLMRVMMGPSRGGAAAAGGEAPEQPEPGQMNPLMMAMMMKNLGGAGGADPSAAGGAGGLASLLGGAGANPMMSLLGGGGAGGGEGAAGGMNFQNLAMMQALGGGGGGGGGGLGALAGLGGGGGMGNLAALMGGGGSGEATGMGAMLKQLAAANNAAAAGMQGAQTRPKMPNMAPQKPALPGSAGTGIMDGGFDPRGLGDVMSKLTAAKNALETGKRLGPDHSGGGRSAPITDLGGNVPLFLSPIRKRPVVKESNRIGDRTGGRPYAAGRISDIIAKLTQGNQGISMFNDLGHQGPNIPSAFEIQKGGKIKPVLSFQPGGTVIKSKTPIKKVKKPVGADIYPKGMAPADILPKDTSSYLRKFGSLEELLRSLGSAHVIPQNDVKAHSVAVKKDKSMKLKKNISKSQGHKSISVNKINAKVMPQLDKKRRPLGPPSLPRRDTRKKSIGANKIRSSKAGAKKDKVANPLDILAESVGDKSVSPMDVLMKSMGNKGMMPLGALTKSTGPKGVSPMDALMKAMDAKGMLPLDALPKSIDTTFQPKGVKQTDALTKTLGAAFEPKVMTNKVLDIGGSSSGKTDQKASAPKKTKSFSRGTKKRLFEWHKDIKINMPKNKKRPRKSMKTGKKIKSSMPPIFAKDPRSLSSIKKMATSPGPSSKTIPVVKMPKVVRPVKPTRPSKPDSSTKRFFAEPIQGPRKPQTTRRPTKRPNIDALRKQLQRAKGSLADKIQRPTRPKPGAGTKKKHSPSKIGAGAMLMPGSGGPGPGSSGQSNMLDMMRMLSGSGMGAAGAGELGPLAALAAMGGGETGAGQGPNMASLLGGLGGPGGGADAGLGGLGALLGGGGGGGGAGLDLSALLKGGAGGQGAGEGLGGLAALAGLGGAGEGAGGLGALAALGNLGGPSNAGPLQNLNKRGQSRPSLGGQTGGAGPDISALLAGLGGGGGGADLSALMKGGQGGAGGLGGLAALLGGGGGSEGPGGLGALAALGNFGGASGGGPSQPTGPRSRGPPRPPGATGPSRNPGGMGGMGMGARMLLRPPPGFINPLGLGRPYIPGMTRDLVRDLMGSQLGPVPMDVAQQAHQLFLAGKTLDQVVDTMGDVMQDKQAMAKRGLLAGASRQTHDTLTQLSTLQHMG